jgi:septum formation protein
MRIILASSSAYRRRLLERLGLSFTQTDPRVDEDRWKSSGLLPEPLAARLAREKADAVAATEPEALIIAGDQVLEFEGDTLGKPGSRERNIAQLTRLSGQSHSLLTAVCVRRNDDAQVFVNRTRLRMRGLTAAEIERYVDHDQAFDCAGGYRIESRGIALFEAIESDDFTAIEGIPLIELARVLREFGVEIP